MSGQDSRSSPLHEPLIQTLPKRQCGAPISSDSPLEGDGFELLVPLTMNDQFENFFKKPWQAPARFPPDTYRTTVHHRPPGPTFTADVLSRMRASISAIHEPITQPVGQTASAPARILRK